ncbi:hypothetical protein EV44_g2145 [Erysiphe necator]|uniref:BTB domain-containing protein n=1 Tax=Uncinula necator TaxID=52586 RepID=A0A0B1P7A1_UNCNE|nr:hypothetical protein EV44_g2145 [Erysiphe necator]
MFKRHTKTKKSGVKKITKVTKTNSFQDKTKLTNIKRSLDKDTLDGSTLFSPIVTITVGREGRIFAAHEDILSLSPFFAVVFKESTFIIAEKKKISLLDEEPEIFSCVLEYLYKGDYFPRLIKGKSKGSWSLENGTDPRSFGVTCYISNMNEYLLRDTVIYCAAEKYGLDELKNIALKKQGLHRGIEVALILRSARFAYANTVISDSKIRTHYISLIIRCRKTFRNSGTMQMEMENGGRIFFDLFVALCNQMDDYATKRIS